jgi:hypothetical protein
VIGVVIFRVIFCQGFRDGDELQTGAIATFQVFKFLFEAKHHFPGLVHFVIGRIITNFTYVFCPHKCIPFLSKTIKNSRLLITL